MDDHDRVRAALRLVLSGSAALNDAIERLVHAAPSELPAAGERLLRTVTCAVLNDHLFQFGRPMRIG